MGKKVLLTDEQCEKLNHCFCEAVADGLSWKEIDETLTEEQRELFHALADSEIPNEEFLPFFADSRKQRTKKIDYSAKIGWEGGIYVLCLRGLPRIESVKYDFMVWWQDINWRGFLLIWKFVSEHKESFRNEIKIAVVEAIETGDPGWIESLLPDYPDLIEMTDEQKRIIPQMLDYADSGKYIELLQYCPALLKSRGIDGSAVLEKETERLYEERKSRILCGNRENFLEDFEKNDSRALWHDMWQFVYSKHYLPDDMQAEIKAVSEDLINIRSDIDNDTVVISGHLPFFMKLCGTEGRTEEFKKILATRKEKNKLTDQEIKQ